MTRNIDKYKSDLEDLIARGDELTHALQNECYPTEFANALGKHLEKEKVKEFIGGLPKFNDAYNSWYSEALALIRQLLPDRLLDFVGHYEIDKNRKEISPGNYKIKDGLLGMKVTRGGYETVADKSAAIPHFQQQLSIIKAIRPRFESSLFDIRQLVQADLFDSELEAANELARSKFSRAAGALGGVVLERHLAQVCDNHSLKVGKKNPGIGDLSLLLKDNAVIDLPQWRFIQHLADIRNLCDHSKKVEPTAEQVTDMLAGVAKVVKTVF